MLPDLPKTITVQLEMIKDVVRSVQEATLESAGALTAEESAPRRHQRMQRILDLAPPPQSPPVPPATGAASQPEDLGYGRNPYAPQPQASLPDQRGNALTPDTEPVPDAVNPFIVAAAQRLRIDPALALSLVRQESNFNPNAKSHTGVEGLFQVTHTTGAPYGQTPDTRRDAVVSTLAGLRYLRDLLRPSVTRLFSPCAPVGVHARNTTSPAWWRS